MRCRWLAILTLMIVFAEVFCVSAQEQAPEPKFRTGDYWHFRVQEEGTSSSSRALRGIYELLYNGANFVVAHGSAAQRMVIEPNEGQLNVLHAMVNRGDLHGGQFLKFPLAVGQNWSFEYKYRPRGLPQPVNYIAHTEVVEMENIQTPAGTFRTFKIIKNVKSKLASKFIYNYSVETKSIVKMFGDFRGADGGTRVVELISFGSMCGATLACDNE